MNAALVHAEVRACYWRDDVNCATTMLRVLTQAHGRAPHPQVLAAATGMHGAGRYGAQCGLVEGGLMFLGVWGWEMGKSADWVEATCRSYAQNFEARFGSLLCRVLRPRGFTEDQPPHLCEGLTLEAALWAVEWTRNQPDRF